MSNKTEDDLIGEEDIARVRGTLHRIEPSTRSGESIPATEHKDKAAIKRKKAAKEQRRLGYTLFAVAAFTLLLCGDLPADNRRWLLIGFSVLMAIGAGWHIDRAKKKLRDDE